MKVWIGYFLKAGLLWSWLTVFSPQLVCAQPIETPAAKYEDALNLLELEALDTYKRQIDQELGLLDTGLSSKEWIMRFMGGEWDLSFQTIFQKVVDLFLREFLVNSALIGKLIVLSVIASLLMHLQKSFSTPVSQIAYFSCYMGIAALAIGSFRLALSAGTGTIDSLTGFMTAMLPQMMFLIAGLGNINGSLLLFPVLMATVTAFANAVNWFVLPLIILSAVLSMVNHLSDTVKVEKLANFFAKLAQVSLGFLITVFVGFITVRTLYAAVLDKVVLRTGKFVTDNAIPVVGKMLSDTLEVTAGYLMMLKNAVSIYGVLVILAIVLWPLLQNAAMSFIYRMAGAIIEPMGDGKIPSLLETMGKHLWMLTGAMASVALMFLIMVALIAGLTNNFTL